MKKLAAVVLTLLLATSGVVRAEDLSGPLILVAKPELRDGLYGASIMVVTPLGDDQHVGFIVNRPTDTALGTLFPDHGPSHKVVDPLYAGGPVGTELIFAMVKRADSPGERSLALMPGLYVAFESAVVDRIIEAESDHARFIAGLVTWQAGELRAEIKAGAWYVLAPDPTIVMRNPQGLWEELVRRSQRADDTI